MNKYKLWLILSVLITAGFTWWAIVHNSNEENDIQFIIVTLGIGLTVNILASLIIVVFFDSRDKKTATRNKRRAAHRIAIELQNYLAGNQHNLSELKTRIEYLRDMFHADLSDQISDQIDTILDSPKPHPTPEIESTLRAIKKEFGPDIIRQPELSQKH